MFVILVFVGTMASCSVFSVVFVFLLVFPFLEGNVEKQTQGKNEFFIIGLNKIKFYALCFILFNIVHLGVLLSDVINNRARVNIY